MQNEKIMYDLRAVQSVKAVTKLLGENPCKEGECTKCSFKCLLKR